MKPCLPRGTLTVSIDLEIDLARSGFAELRAIEDAAVRLLALLAKFQMAATWAVADPAGSAARGPITAMRGGHELAILGDASWVGRETVRACFGRELARRMAAARAQGIAPGTLVVPMAPSGDHCDLAIKEGIVAVRHPAIAPPRLQPRALRYGLWSFPVSLELPRASAWLAGGGGLRAARRAIDEAIAARGLVQLAIDLPRLAARGRAAERIIHRVVEYADRRRREGALDVDTLGATAGRLGQKQHGKPSRSILRPAA